ncbi:hypothetical protein Poli38472_014290 [Pythium oligandrum]|uniref:Pseudouridine synthase RsuA/RluA-like domain-containing protein n=1 Tax=Pythium oligandrum TaxID=41045 RepID=A0A8K1CJP3_PYTOL|nr:hypothetical protein Poli38472_014290 [Pythium oligandrum]|eukprot:TMW64173.1 hypothetical protein Poli38472_014290 [Pythium oligandrum]
MKLMRPAKRVKRAEDVGDDDTLSTPAERDGQGQLLQEMKEMLAHLMQSFSLAATDEVGNEKLLKLRSLAHIRAGYYTSDIAVRLYHQYIRPRQKTALETIARDGFESSEAFAAACVERLAIYLDHQSARSRHIRRVMLSDKSMQDKGILPDRLVVVIHQVAREVTNGGDVASRLKTRLQVLYHDECVLVINKPANFLSVDGTTPDEESVQGIVRQYYPDARMVHRLDFETSGLLAIALTKTASQALNRQFRERTVDKSYTARVYKSVEKDSGCIKLRMEPSTSERLVQNVVEEGGAETHTEWRVLERGQCDTLMELKPVTGKTHQLRVHMQWLGHPILGDSLYSPDIVQPLAPRLLLHATELSFTHPLTQVRVTIRSECPLTNASD